MKLHCLKINGVEAGGVSATIEGLKKVGAVGAVVTRDALEVVGVVGICEGVKMGVGVVEACLGVKMGAVGVVWMTA